jgi:hypothetical protein
LLRLVRSADAVVENFRPGTMEKLGIGADVLREINPRLVVTSLTGFGLDGPYRDRPAFDMIVQALGGGMSLTGEIGGKPVRSGLPIGDLCAGYERRHRHARRPPAGRARGHRLAGRRRDARHPGQTCSATSPATTSPAARCPACRAAST